MWMDCRNQTDRYIFSYREEKSTEVRKSCSRPLEVNIEDVHNIRCSKDDVENHSPGVGQEFKTRKQKLLSRRSSKPKEVFRPEELEGKQSEGLVVRNSDNKTAIDNESQQQELDHKTPQNNRRILQWNTDTAEKQNKFGVSQGEANESRIYTVRTAPKRKFEQDVERKPRRITTHTNSDGQFKRSLSCHDSRIVRVSRSSGGKDRHSKVLTAKGLRDRRVRLSVSTAIQFYDLQDRLGYDQPSKAVEWLIKAATDAIDELPVLSAEIQGTISNAQSTTPPLGSSKESASNSVLGDLTGHEGAVPINMFPESSSALGVSSTNESQSSREGMEGQCEMQAPAVALGKSSSSTSEGSKGADTSGLSLSRSESRAKARERARERAQGKKPAKDTPWTGQNRHFQSGNPNQTNGFRDSFIGLLNSVAYNTALENHIPQTARDSPSPHKRHREISVSHSNAAQHEVSCDPAHSQKDDLCRQDAHQILHMGSLGTSSTAMQQSSSSQSFFSPSSIAAILSPINLQRNEMGKPSVPFSGLQEKHLLGNLIPFTSNPVHSSFLLNVDQEMQEQFVPAISNDLSFSMPGLSGRETLQSNSYNHVNYIPSSQIQRISSAEASHSMFTSTARTHFQGYDARVIDRTVQEFSVAGSRDSALKWNRKHDHQFD